MPANQNRKLASTHFGTVKDPDPTLVSAKTVLRCKTGIVHPLRQQPSFNPLRYGFPDTK